jgi:hypothetical protein
MIVTAMVMNIGETTFYSQVLQGFLWIWMGIGASSSTRLSGGGRSRTRTFLRTNSLLTGKNTRNIRLSGYLIRRQVKPT